MVARIGLCALLALALVTSAAAQTRDEWDPRATNLTRADLTGLLDRYEKASESSAYSDVLRSRARIEAGLIRQRLESGDFQVGDRIALSVTNEPTLTDTFAVREPRVIELPQIGQISLAGVLRSELETYLTQQIGRYLRNPRVRAQSLIRLAVAGGAGSPGFYTVPTQALLSDVLTRAGGLPQGARFNQVHIERNGQTLWEGDQLAQAIADGRTVEQMALQAGDRIVLPGQGRSLSGAYAGVRTLSMLLALPFSVLALTRIF